MAIAQTDCHLDGRVGVGSSREAALVAGAKVMAGVGGALASLFAGCTQRLLQQPEIRPPLIVEHDGFPIDDHRRRPQRSGGLLYGRKPMGPVVAAAGKDPDPLGLDMDRKAIAIPFQLPTPFVSGGRFSLQ
uniref:Uncharacterized protein n=1 Tax=Agrobacterium tumefaciens TaxID=358 RepID=A0A5B9T1X7_AGRTU|nr:hypothetical protein AgrTiKerr27_00138 [Agrobacterium tumefaciens]